MAVHSYRYQPIFKGGAWWRADISWRDASTTTDQHTFKDEWTGSITEEPADEFTYYTFRDLEGKVTNDGDVISIDAGEFTFASETNIDDCLDPTNESAEIRLWWSADGSTNWQPIFWGEIDVESVSPEAQVKVGSTWVKTWQFTAIDCIRQLNDRDFGDLALYGTSVSSYSRDVSTTGSYDIYWGASKLHDMYVDWIYSTSGTPPGGSTMQPYDSVVKLTYYLTQTAKTCFHEHVYQSPANGCYLFHSTTGMTTILTAGAYKANSDPLGTPVEAEFFDWWVPYPLFETGEFSTEWDNLGEFADEMAKMIGCTITTRHVIEATGEWVRQLWYVPRHSTLMHTVTPNGVLMTHKGPSVRWESKKVTVTSRFPSGAVSMYDQSAGTGAREAKFGIHLRTVMAKSPQGYYPGWEDVSGFAVQNTIWQVLVIPDTGTRMQLANYVRLGATYYPTTQAAQWTTELNRGYNGLADAMANWYADNVYVAKYRIEEEYSRANASDGTNDHPGVWVPCAKIGDQEDTGGTYRILEYSIDAENNRVKIVKEKI